MIKNKKYRLVLDLKKNFVSSVETLVQNDVNTNEFEIELFDDGVPYLIDEKNKLEVAAKKSDGTVVVDSATGIQNTVSWQLSEQALTASGYVEAEVRVLEDTGVLTASQYFKFLVRPNLINDETIKSTSQYRALDEAVKKAEELKKELEGVPEKVAEIKSEFDNVKTTLENTQKELLAGLQLSNQNIDEINTYLNGVNAEIQKIKDKEIDIENLRALLKNLEDLKARLATLESTLSDAKTTNANLETNIKTSNKNISDMNSLINTARDVGNSLTSDTTAGRSVDAALKGSITKGNQIVANVNSADKTITEKINTATTIGQSLDESVKKGRTTKTSLDESIKNAETTKTNLDSSNTTATTTKTELDKSAELAKTKKTELDGSISTAKTTKTALDSSIKTGKDVNTKSASLKAELDESVTNATNAKMELDTSTDTAKKVKTELDGSIASATTKNTELKGTTTTAESTDTEAKKTIETLEALLTKSEGSEKSLREIIASGNLDKYVTDPKLVEVLKDYALKTDLKTNLSDFADDETHRTVTDTEKTSWNNKAEKTDIPTKLSGLENDETFKTEAEIKALIKTEAPKQDLSGYALKTDLKTLVSKVDGKGLSTNDYTDKAKAKVDAIPANPKYTDTTYDLTPYAKKTDLMTESTVNSLIAKSTKLKKEVVTALPSTGKDDVLYLKKDGNDVNNSYVEYMWINGGWEIIGNTKIDLNPYAKKTDIKTKLSELTDDNTHRTVTDSEKSTWNSKLSSVSGQDVSSAKAANSSGASTWGSGTRTLEYWIGDFDKRTRENKTKIDGVQSMTTTEVEAILNEVFR